MKLIDVSEKEAREYMRAHYANAPLGRIKVDFQNGSFATDYTLDGEIVLRILTDPNIGTQWKVGKRND